MAPRPTKPLHSMQGHSVTAVPMRTSGSVAAMSNPMFKGDPPYTGAWADAAYDPETPGPIYHPGGRGRKPGTRCAARVRNPCPPRADAAAAPPLDCLRPNLRQQQHRRRAAAVHEGGDHRVQ